MSEDIVEVQIFTVFKKKPVAEGKMSAELVGKINKALAVERGCEDTMFEVKVKKSCQAERQKA